MRVSWMLAGTLCMISTPALAQGKPQDKAQDKIEWLFIQTAARSVYDGKTLRLEGVGPQTMQFADRPARVAVDVPTVKFITAWTASPADGLASDPPNAGLAVVVDGVPHVATVELLDPKLNGDVLEYRVRVIDGKVPSTGGATSLFVDGAPIINNSGRGFPIHVYHGPP